ncbi:hypothetical protein VNO78_21298 [Psophocarpus tetragonolobus]|uniref:AP2/ERF domain-containing protein n=1 Tax=Psophocarpus tetragonolobus TaxID=3891 RepID=A0AAN9SAU9_PSOTE
MFSTLGIPCSWSQIQEAYYPEHETTFQYLFNCLFYDPENGALIPVPNHVQGNQFLSNLIEFNKGPPQQSAMKSHKRTRCKGRFESFVWDKDPKSTEKKGKTGGFKNELEAARAHDLIAFKIWGRFACTNFPVLCYLKEIVDMQSMTLRECILAIRRRTKNSITTGFYDCKISSFKGASIDQREENHAIGNAMLNLDFTTMQQTAQKIDQKYQEQTTLQNQIVNVAKKLLENLFLHQQFKIMQSMLQKIGQKSQESTTVQNQNENVGLDNQFLHQNFPIQLMLQMIGKKCQEPITALQNQNEDVGKNLLDNQFLYQNFRNMQPMLQNIGQQCQEPITLQNQTENVHENNPLDSQFLYQQNFTSMQPMLQNIGERFQEPITLLNEQDENVGENFLHNQFLNQNFAPMQPMLQQEMSQRSQEPETWQNQIENVNYENLFGSQVVYDDQYPLSGPLAFQNEPSFQNDPSLPLWPYGFGNAIIQDHANGLGNALNWESSMSQKGDENPAGAGNDGVGSFGSSSSLGFHSVEPNTQQYEAPALGLLVERYEPFQYGSATSTHSKDENMVDDNDWDISQYLNLDGPDMDD